MSDQLDELLQGVPALAAPEWQQFPADSGSLNIPRASMPQIKSAHRGAMVQFLKGRGISHSQEEIAPSTLKPSQSEFSPQKVARARGFEGPQRSILASADDHVIDGHHQWLASLHDAPDEPIPVIRLNAPAHQLLIEAARFPSSGVDDASEGGAPPAQQDELDSLLRDVPALKPRQAKSAARRAAKTTAPAPSPVPGLPPAPGASRVRGLEAFVTSSGFERSPGRSGYATGGHNPGSPHYSGYAVDVRTKDRTPEEVEAFIAKATAAGYTVRDERTRPAGQGVWDGPHLHLEYDELGKALSDLPDVDELDAALSDVPSTDDEVVKTEATLDSKTGGPLSLTDSRRTLPVDAAAVQTGDVAAPLMPPLRSSALDVQTMEGRAQRDAGRAIEASPQGRKWIDVKLPAGVRDWAELSGSDVAKQTTRQWAAERGIEPAFVNSWLEANGKDLHIYDLGTGKPLETGEAMGRDDIYNTDARTFRLSAEMPHLKKLEDDYKLAQYRASGIPGADEATSVNDISPLLRSLSDEQASPGEKLLAVVGPPARFAVEKGARAADIATRPLQAIDAGFWARLHGVNDLTALKTAYAQFFGDKPELGKNVIAEALKNSDRLKAINPRLPSLLGELANVVLEPSNLIPIGAGAKLLRGGEEASALGRLTARVGEGAREAGLLDRGFVGARPLGIEAAEASAKVAGDGPASELLTHARERLQFYEAEAVGATNPLKKQNALALAEDFRTEVERLESGASSPQAQLQPVPESPETLRAQLNALIEGRRAVVHVTPGEKITVPRGFKSFKDFDGGRIIYDPRVVTKEQVVEAMDAGKLGELMGHITPKAEADGVVVAARDARTGTELQASYTNPETASAQADAFASQYPGAKVEVGGADLERQLLADREAVPRGDQPSLLRRAGRTAVDVVQLSKAKAGFDLSATGRQGLAQILAHPSYFKEAMSRQVKAFASEDAANAFAESTRSRPDFQLLRENVDLSSVGDIREEPFASGLTKQIPGVRGSDRAYSAATDSIRVQAWDNYTRSVAGNPYVNADTYKAIGELINISTGRGRVPILDRSELGRKVINALNVPFFSPRNTAAKFNLLSPARVARNAMNPATRPVAWLQMRDAARGLAVLGTTMGLMSYAGLDVGLNPFKSDFGKLRVGKAVYDLTGGEGATVRYMAQMAHLFSKAERGEKAQQTPTSLTLRYLRSQLQPAAAVVVDKATGETFDKQPFTYSQAAADLVVPFVVADAYKGWVAAGGSTIEDIDEAGTRGDFLNGDFSKVHSGFKGAASALPGVFGVGVGYYDKPEDYEAEKASRQPMPAPSGAVAEEAKRLKLTIPPLPKSVSVEGITGDTMRLHSRNGEDLPSLSDEEYAKVKADYATEILTALDETITNPDYKSFESDADRRQHLDFIMKSVLDRFLNGQRLGIRERQLDDLDNLEEYQRKLEGRSRQLKPGEVMKLGEPDGKESLQSQMRWKGREGSANVEDQRSRPRAGWTEEDGQVLADEVLSAGPSPVDDAQAAQAALLLDSLDEHRFAAFAKSLEESVKMGAVGEGASAAGEYAAKGLTASGGRDVSEMPRVMRLLARERRLRPAQFVRDVLAGKYGTRLRDEVKEDTYYPANQCPWER